MSSAVTLSQLLVFSFGEYGRWFCSQIDVANRRIHVCVFARHEKLIRYLST